MKPSLYAFYGSLRRGMRLHNQFKNELHYLYSIWLTGYDLYSLVNYPYAVKSLDSTHKILVEVMSVSNPETAASINQIEIDAGYRSEKIMIGIEPVTIFLYEETANNLRIVSGDWGVFFGQ